MTANFRDKRTSITTMQAKNRAFAIFSTPLISHYPLSLILLLTEDYDCAGFCDLSVLRCDPKFHICLIAHSFIHRKGGQCWIVICREKKNVSGRKKDRTWKNVNEVARRKLLICVYILSSFVCIMKIAAEQLSWAQSHTEISPKRRALFRGWEGAEQLP